MSEDDTATEPTDGPTDGSTDGPTDGPTDEPSPAGLTDDAARTDSAAGAAQTPPTDPTVPDTRAETALGLDANLAAALAYLFGFVSGAIVYVVEDENEFVRFHAAQSIVVSIVVFVAYFGLSVGGWMLGFFLEFIPAVGGILSLLVTLVMLVLMPLLGLAILGLYLFMMYKAYSEERWRVPFLGKIAEEYLL